MPVSEEKMRTAARLLAERAVSITKPAATPADAAPARGSLPTSGGPVAQTDKRMLEQVLHDAEKVAVGVGLLPVRISASVGRGGKNNSDDVETVQARLVVVGYATGPDMDGLIKAIERYQSDVVGLHPPDGRIDVGGRTIAALAGGTTAAAHVAPAHPETIRPSEPASLPSGGRPTTSSGVLTGDLADMVRSAHNPAVDAAALKLTDLEHKYHAAKRAGGADHPAHGEMSGQDRDALVKEIAELRSMVAALTEAGIPATELARLQAAFYRAIDLVAPYYYQHNNVMLEYSKERGARADIFNTCNITSLGMCLQALGLSAQNYDRPQLLAPIIQYFHKDIEKALEVANPDLSGYRLPDVLGMAAVAENLSVKDKPGHDHLETAASAAMSWVPNIEHMRILASRFGVGGQVGSFHHDELAAYGAAHHMEAAKRSDSRRQGRKVDDEGLSTPEIEKTLPLDKFRRDILSLIGPMLDQGKQVVAGQFNHFVRIESVSEQSVIKDDPGNWLRSNDKLTWEEVRALGLFENYLVLG
jgi:hypothetical protein